MNKPHKHAEFIKAKADGAVVECRMTGIENQFYAMDDDDFDFPSDHEYRIKPPAPKLPETTMTYSQMCMAYKHEEKDGVSWHSGAARNLANAAIAYALETGQVVLP